MKASTLVSLRRGLGRWMTYSVPAERDCDPYAVPPDPIPPPRPEQLTLPGIADRTGPMVGPNAKEDGRPTVEMVP